MRTAINSLKNVLIICFVIVFLEGFLAAIVVDFGDEPTPSKTREVTAERIDATLLDDGTLHVVDARTYKFTGSFTLVGEELDPPTYGAAQINGVSVIDADGTRTELEKVDFDTEWRYAGGAGDGRYSVDEPRDTIYAFTDSSDEEKTIVFDYSYSAMVDVYRDCGILYWQFVPRGRGETASDIVTTLTLPVPEGDQVHAAGNVYAWGHCELGGDVAFNPGGTIAFNVPQTEPGVFAEMRVAFPPEWAAGVTDRDLVHSYDELDSVKAEEQAWADEAAREAERHEFIRHLSGYFLVGLLVVSLGIAALALFLFLRYGREHKPQFTESYWRDVPAPGAGPAHVARVWRWNKHSNDDISTMLLHLENKGLVKLEPTTVSTQGLFGSKEKQTYRVTRTMGDHAPQNDTMEEATLDLVFNRIGGGRSSITLADIEQLGKDRPSSFTSNVNRWQTILDKQVKSKGYFEQQGAKLQKAMRWAGVGIVACSFLVGPILWFTPLSFLVEEGTGLLTGPVFCLLPGALALLAFSPFMTRRSQEAVDIHARCKALKRWFHDFTALDEALPTDAKVWGELLVYASMFGVADQVVNQLRVAMPELFETADFPGSASTGSASSSGPALRSGLDRDMIVATSAFSASIGAAMRTAKSEITKASALDAIKSIGSSGGGGGGSSWSGGGGGGGGSFSSGGGGGHGGGGGSFAR